MLPKYHFLAYFSLFFLGIVSVSHAQIIPDQTLGRERSHYRQENIERNGSEIDSDVIEGGAIRGSNLFHSFSEFNVEAERSAYFDLRNVSAIRNILTRITGSNPSNILGVLGILENGNNANLFLINPNGVIFGANSQLDLSGSFIASTADSIVFDNGFEFSASQPQAPPLLTINIPIGLRFGNRTGQIINRSTFPLSVQPGKTIGLIGGDIFMGSEDNTNAEEIAPSGIFSPSSRIELGGVGDNSFVRLIPISSGWALDYEGVENFRDIQLSQLAFVDASAVDETGNGGAIQLQGRNISITDGSGVVTFTFVSGAIAGDISIQASESLELNNFAEITNAPFDATPTRTGEIKIQTRQLIVNDSFIDTVHAATLKGGSIVIEATELVEVNTGQLVTTTFGAGDAGDLQITTERLIIQDGGQVLSSTLGSGNGGNLTINTKQLIIQGRGLISVAASEGSTGQAGNLTIDASESVILSGIDSSILATSETTSAGNITLDTPLLTIQKGAILSASTQRGSAGNLTVNASEFIKLRDNGTLSVEATQDGTAGNLNLNTNQLTVFEGAQISVSSPQGQAGDININANILSLNQGSITASTETGSAGNLTVNTSELIKLRDNGRLSVEATQEGTAGNLSLNTKQLDVFDDAQISVSSPQGQAGDINIKVNTLSLNQGSITASTQTGQAGNLTVNTSEFIKLRDQGRLSVEAAQGGIAGNLNLNTSQLSVFDGAKITVSSLEGQAGNININANILFLNQGSITAETGKIGVEGANISLNVSEFIRMENESLISATANSEADGGNIEINSPFLVVFPPTGANGSDIIAKAERGDGGRIVINSEGIFGIRERQATDGNQTNDLDASSEFGASGEIIINREPDPNRGLEQLPETVIDPNTLITQNLCETGSASELIVKGRGGLPPSLNEDLNSQATQVELINPVSSPSASPASPAPSASPALVPTQGWVFNEKGEVVLVGYNPSITGSQRLRKTEKGCTQ